MRQFLDILLDGASILPKVRSMRIDRRKDQAIDTLSLELADFSLYASLNFGTVPTAERIHVATAKGDPKTDGSTAGSGVLTSASSNFTAEGVTLSDLILVLSSSVAGDVGTWAITAVGTTTVTSSHVFGTATGINFIILKNQGKFFAEKPDVAEDRNQVAIPSLWGRCGLARMIDPFAGKLTKSYTTATTFYALVKELVSLCGMDPNQAQFDIDDYSIPPNIYSVSNQYPLQIVIDLAHKSNGYVRCKKDGNLWIRKDLYHFGALPVAQALTDAEIMDCRQEIEYPQFGNRILVHSSVSSGGMNVRVRLRLETSCIRGNGVASTRGEAIVTDGAGNAVADGTPVDWSIDSPNLAVWSPTQSETQSRGVSGELQVANDLQEVSTDYPIREVLGVYLENDPGRVTNFFTGGTFVGSRITLGLELPFTDSKVLVDYIAGGIAVSDLVGLANAPEAETFVHAAVGKVRDTVDFCINNNRNVSITLKASKTEYNLCIGEQAAISTLVAQVKIDGSPGQGAMVSWKRTGDARGTLSPAFTSVRNLSLTERTTSQNNFTVHVEHEIQSVQSVFLDSAGGETGINYYANAQNRRPSFFGTEITLGTNLPQARMPVVVRYTAVGVARSTYTNPQQIGNDTITAELADRTSTPESAQIDITTINSCSDEGGGSQPPPPDPGEKDCSNSTPSAQNCDARTYPNAQDANREECVCRLETGKACPTNEEECRKMCEGFYNKYGASPLDCDRIPTREEVRAVQRRVNTPIPVGKEAAYVSCAKECNNDPDCINSCVSDHAGSTIDRCTKKCMDHGLQISPRSGTIDCDGAKKITFTASGGKPPYKWSATIGQLKSSGDKNETAELTPPENAGSGVSGTAYASVIRGCYWFGAVGCGPGGGSGILNFIMWQNYSCADAAQGGCSFMDDNAGSEVGCTDGPDDPVFCVDGPCEPHLCFSGPCAGGKPWGGAGPPCSEAQKGAICDKRTQTMKDQGCNPCGLAFKSGGVVTVRDSAGKSVSATVTAAG